MIGLLQRVSQARVEVNQQVIAAINTGLVVLIGIEKADTETRADRLLQRLLGYRVFPDNDGKMNLSLTDTNGDLLLVPQFTLPADTMNNVPDIDLDFPRSIREELILDSMAAVK